jgi:ribonuclease-3
VANLDQLVQRIGHSFTSNDIFQRALTHSSYRNREARKHGNAQLLNNERLEFLGDRVLGLVIADWLFTKFPDQTEGDLAPKLNALVRKETCAQTAQDIDLGSFLKLGHGEESAGGRDKMAVLGNAMEALIAAVYLDGGLPAAEKMILKLWAPYLETIDDLPKDPKTALQEWAQARGLPAPDYVEISRSGPDHQPVFEMAAQVSGYEPETAKGPSKRIAEQTAAETLLRREKVW